MLESLWVQVLKVADCRTDHTPNFILWKSMWTTIFWFYRYFRDFLVKKSSKTGSFGVSKNQTTSRQRHRKAFRFNFKNVLFVLRSVNDQNLTFLSLFYHFVIFREISNFRLQKWHLESFLRIRALFLKCAKIDTGLKFLAICWLGTVHFANSQRVSARV